MLWSLILRTRRKVHCWEPLGANVSHNYCFWVQLIASRYESGHLFLFLVLLFSFLSLINSSFLVISHLLESNLMEFCQTSFLFYKSNNLFITKRYTQENPTGTREYTRGPPKGDKKENRKQKNPPALNYTHRSHLLFAPHPS